MMNSTRFNTLYKGLPSLARIVYSAVPIKDAWTAKQVAAELTRAGHGKPINHVLGGLNILIANKMVQEPSAGLFARCPVRGAVKLDEAPEEPAQAQDKVIAEPTPEPTPKTESATKPTTEKEPEMETTNTEDPIDKITKLSAKVRGFVKELNQLAEELENAAVEFTEQREDLEKSTTKMRQFQALLKELT